jgi:hypothetical protein
MKILWIYNQHNPSLEYDHFLHMDFVRYIHHHLDFVEYFDKDSKILNEIQIKAYGANLTHYSDISLKYSKERTLRDVYLEYPFDIVIVNTKGRCFAYYSITPEKEDGRDSYLPPDFKEFNLAPKVMIEEDYQYEHNNNWYISQGFKAILHRHYSNHLKCEKFKDIKSVFFPFSVNTEIFRPASIEHERVCFCGNSDHEIYQDRKEMIDRLKESYRKDSTAIDSYCLIDDFKATKRFDEYIRTLQSYTASLCGVTIYNLTPSKLFEILACGSVLITNNVSKSGVDQLFSSSSYVTFQSNYSDYVKNVKRVLLEPEYALSLRNSGLKDIRNKHTHNIRIKELLNILKTL